jgi:hypothetical protein
MPRPRAVEFSEILDYFGKCPRGNYPASAIRITHMHPDGPPKRLVIATCDLPCGWRGSVPLTRMTTGLRPRARHSAAP